MRPWLRFPFLALAAVVLLLGACSRDDEDAGGTIDLNDPDAGAALSGYWEAGDAAGTALAASEDLWASFAALAADPTVLPDSTLQAARAYAAACTTAAADLAAWRELELAIAPVGGGKAQISREARQTALEVLEVAATAVRTGAEGLVVSWQVLGGIHGLREALADPDGTLPVTGRLAEALDARLQARDAAVVEAILAGQDRGGVLPLAQIEGDTPAAQAAWHTDLDGDHPLKRQCRAAVPAFDAAEREASLALLGRAARGQLRIFPATGAGGAGLAALSDQLAGPDEAGPTGHETTLALVSGTDGQPVTGPAMVLIRRRGLPEEDPRLALLDAAAAQVILHLPAGRYDVLALADGWARAVACDRTVAGPGTLALSLSHLQEASLILEEVVAPPMAGAGTRVTATAVAASAAGRGLTFDWTVRGPCESVTPGGPDCTFVPASAGAYTAVVTVRDDVGASATDSTTITVAPFAVEVFRTDFLAEQVVDHHFNPGEQDTLWLWVANRGDQDLDGVARLQGRDGLDVDVTSETWSLPAGRQTRWQVAVPIPADYDRPRARLDFSFTAGGHTLVQELDYRVDFYAELARIASPQTSRIITVSGTVANPALESAELVVDRDRNQVYQLPLQNGAFEQVVILSGTDETARRRLEVTAHAGNRRASARAGFMAAIPRADFRATLFWDTDGTDVDLWVTDPDGEKCYYANETTASGLELDVDDVTGYGPENVTGERDLPAGEYLIQVHYFSDHGTGLPTEATVMITMHEGSEQETVQTASQTITDGDVWTVATVTWDGTEVVSVRPAPRHRITVVPRGLPAK